MIRWSDKHRATNAFKNKKRKEGGEKEFVSTYFSRNMRTRSLSLVFAISREIPFLLCPNFRRVLISRLVGKASLFFFFFFFFSFHTRHYDSFRVTLQEKLLLHFVLSRENALLELLSLREMLRRRLYSLYS